MDELRVIPVRGVPEIKPGDDVAAEIVAHLAEPLADGDILVVTQKVVSKAEDRLVPSSQRAAALAAETTRVLRRSGSMTIAETRQGFVCANAGVDASNVPEDSIALLPLDPDASARRIRSRVRHIADVDVAVIVTDTFGRAWRLGQTDVAIGVAGIEPFVDHRGTTDPFGRELNATRICAADELAGAAELVMGKTQMICAAVIKGATVTRGRGSAVEIARPPGEDFFR
jgi:coenzyme F420-0:L-glutamate ligase / coenzyme F420-1:gamma-L-glutamate ligase